MYNISERSHAYLLLNGHRSNNITTPIVRSEVGLRFEYASVYFVSSTLAVVSGGGLKPLELRALPAGLP